MRQFFYENYAFIALNALPVFRIMRRTIILAATSGFTLIELLVVIGILSIISIGLVIAIDPADKLKQAGDARVISDIGAISRAMEAYVTGNTTYPAAITDLVPNELKALPIPPSGYCVPASGTAAYGVGNCTFTALKSDDTAGCTLAAKNCAKVIIFGELRSKKYTATPFWRFESATGKSCARANATTACP